MAADSPGCPLSSVTGVVRKHIATKTTSTAANEDGDYRLGEVMTYDITVKNEGNVPYYNVIVTDVLVDAEILTGEGYIINEDGLQVVVAELGESSVNLSVRGWTKTENYWSAYFSMLEEIKLAFDEEGIEIPFNYLNVNVIKN